MGRQPEQTSKVVGSLDPLSWPWEAMQSAIGLSFWWLDQGWSNPCRRDEPTLPWTTPNKVVLELASVRLRDFSKTRTGYPALICAPHTLHSALITDFGPGHSIVETLQSQGVDSVYVTDWRSASHEMRFLSIDSYLADLNVAIDEIGPPVDLVGLCQGGWMSLIYAARFPLKIRRLVLVGAPVDLSVESDLSRMVANASKVAFDGFVNGEGGIVRGDHLLRFWSSPLDPELELQRTLSPEIASSKEMLDRFACWYRQALDLPGAYYLQTVNWIFRENRIAAGSFTALGRQINLKQVTLPVFLLAGAKDEVVPAEQALATAMLLGTPPALMEAVTAPSTHLGLFIGGRTLPVFWRRIARWLSGGEQERRRVRPTSIRPLADHTA